MAFQAILVWLATPILGAVVARGAVSVQSFRAPLLIFPLLVGCVLGLLLAGMSRLGQIGHRATLVCGAVLAVAVAVAGQHYFSFLDWKAAQAASRKEGRSIAELMVVKEMSPDEPIDFAQFMQMQAAIGRPVTSHFPPLRGAAAWASWFTDGLLTLIAAVTIVCVACRTPYCSTCRAWYRTIRAGPLSAERACKLAGAVAARQGIAAVPPPLEPGGEARYRLSHCMGGCGPSRLELAFRRPKTAVVEAWLSTAERERLVRILDDENPESKAN